jgi:hypothetical protein
MNERSELGGKNERTAAFFRVLGDLPTTTPEQRDTIRDAADHVDSHGTGPAPDDDADDER